MSTTKTMGGSTVQIFDPGENYNLPALNQNFSNTADEISLIENKFAKGRLYLNRVTATAGTVTALTVISSIPTFTFKGGRKYRIVWDSDWLSSVAAAAGAFYIATAPTTDAAALTTGITNLAVRDAPATIANTSMPMKVEAYFDPAADTTVQLKFLAQPDGGGGNVTVQSNRVGGTIYAIYDDGAQY